MIDPNNPPQHDTVLDVTEEQIARTYAEALFGAAGDNALSAVEELQAIRSEVLEPHPGFLEPLRSAFLSHEERVAMLDRVFGGRLSEVVLNFLKVLSKHNRLGILRSVVAQAVNLADQRSGRVRVHVRTATELDAATVGEIENTLRAKIGKDPVVSQTVDPDLIAGMQVQVGDTVYDSSLRTSLAKARKSIIAHTIEQIERNPESFLSTN